MGLQITYDPPVAKPIQGIVPPGGFHYFQGDVRLNADTMNDLYKKVTDYRAENALPNNTTKEDVDNYVCGHFPDYCHTVDSVTVRQVVTGTKMGELMGDIQVWAKNILSSTSEHPLVGDELAEARAQICGKCPYNVNWRGGCNSCIAATDRLSASVRQARETTSTPVLGGCSILRHDNRAAVFMQPEDLAISSDTPDFCWLNK